jgi:hypothetical protein
MKNKDSNQKNKSFIIKPAKGESKEEFKLRLKKLVLQKGV